MPPLHLRPHRLFDPKVLLPPVGGPIRSHLLPPSMAAEPGDEGGEEAKAGRRSLAQSPKAEFPRHTQGGAQGPHHGRDHSPGPGTYKRAVIVCI